MMNFFIVVIDSLLIWISAYIIGKNSFDNDTKQNYLKVIISILILSITLGYINFINAEIFHGVFKILSIYFLYCIFYKINFSSLNTKVVVASLVVYILFIVSEVSIVIPLSIIFSILKLDILILKNTLIINFLISLFAIFISKILKNELVKIVNNTNLVKNVKFLIVIIILIELALLGFKLPLSQWKFNTEFLVTMLIIISFCIVGIFVLKQNYEIEKTTSMYQQVVKYSNTTNKVLEDYRMISHEHKNQLSIIRQMILKNKKEAIEYIDSLIEKRNDIKYKWVAELNKLPLEGLKGLINYKLIEAEENNIYTSVIISKDVSKVKLSKLSSIQKDHLYSICGVYLDNAIQAASKNKIKEMNIEIYKENKELVFIIANTFSGKIELERIEDYGYSTKGKNHGVGLHLVKRIIDEDKLYSQSRKIIDNYYAQELRINLKELTKKKK